MGGGITLLEGDYPDLIFSFFSSILESEKNLPIFLLVLWNLLGNRFLRIGAGPLQICIMIKLFSTSKP